MRLLKVPGKGYVTTEPDKVTLPFGVEAKARDYEEFTGGICQFGCPEESAMSHRLFTAALRSQQECCVAEV